MAGKRKASSDTKSKDGSRLSKKDRLEMASMNLYLVLYILKNNKPLTGWLRDWLKDALERIQAGENAKNVFGTGGTQGRKSSVNYMQLYYEIEALAQSHNKTHAIEIAANKVNLSVEAVTKIYYKNKVAMDNWTKHMRDGLIHLGGEKAANKLLSQIENIMRL